MTGKQFERLARKHLGALLDDGYVAKGKLLYEAPVGLIVRGFAVDDSSFDATRFTFWVFAQPLYVPEPTLVFNIGRRLGQLGGGQEKWWTLTPENEAATFGEVRAEMGAAARAFVARCRNPGDLADFVPTIVSAGSFYAEEALAYSCILADRLDEVPGHIERLRAIMGACQYDWQRAVLARAERVESALASDPDEARRVLSGWADETAGALGITRGP